MNVINKISQLGNDFFNWLVDGVLPLPGIVKGIIVIVLFCLIVVGFLTLLKKSLKVFGMITIIVILLILILSLTTK